MSKVSHIRIYPSDWRSGCLGLTLEQEGLYIRMCMFIAEANRRVPLDDTEAARMLNVQTRNYRRVLGELLRLGKLQRHENGYGNKRVEAERDIAARAADRKPASGQAEEPAERTPDEGPEREDRRYNGDVTPIYSGYNGVITEVAGEISEQNQAPFKEPEVEKEDTPLPPRGPTPLDALKAFEAYNATALRCGLPQAAKLTPDRQRKIIARLKDYGLEGWTQALANIEKSSFLTGGTEANFRADLEFMVQAKSFGKLHDGGYGNGRHAPPKAYSREPRPAWALPARPREEREEDMQRRVNEEMRAQGLV